MSSTGDFAGLVGLRQHLKVADAGVRPGGPGPGYQLPVDVPGGGLQRPQRRMGLAVAGIGVHGDLRPHIVTGNVRKEAQAHRSGERHGQNQHQQGDKGDGHGIAVGQGQLDGRFVKTIVEPLQAGIGAVLDPLPQAQQRVAAGPLAGVQVRQVSGQDQFGFHHRQQQADGHDGGELSVQLAQPAADVGQGKERHHRGEHTEQGRYRHPQGSLDGVTQGVAFFAAHCVHAFADHHGVVHHDTQCHDKTERGELVQRQPGEVIAHEIKGSEENERQPHGYPEGDGKIQKQRQQHEHHQDAGRWRC